MSSQICIACGCMLGEESYERDGAQFCCEECADDEACTCEGCTMIEDDDEFNDTGVEDEEDED